MHFSTKGLSSTTNSVIDCLCIWVVCYCVFNLLSLSCLVVSLTCNPIPSLPLEKYSPSPPSRMWVETSRSLLLLFSRVPLMFWCLSDGWVSHHLLLFRYIRNSPRILSLKAPHTSHVRIVHERNDRNSEWLPNTHTLLSCQNDMTLLEPFRREERDYPTFRYFGFIAVLDNRHPPWTWTS